MKSGQKIFVTLCLSAFFFASFWVGVSAEDSFSVSPAIMDLKVKPRERIEKEISVKNHVQRKISVYARVLDIETEKGKEIFREPSDSDKTASLANWTSAPAGAVELLPGEEKIVPIIIDVNPRAKIGVYHARIAFGEGGTRSAAEAGGGEGVLLNLEVWEEKKEFLALKYFRPDRGIFWGMPVMLLYSLENTGTEEMRPKGEIILYGKKGEEIGTVNLDIPALQPGEVYEAERAWDGGWFFGSGKATLSVSYGEAGVKNIRDTIFFQVIPWQAGAASLMGAGMFVYIKKRKK